MNITGLNPQMMTANNSYASASTVSQSTEFQSILNDLQRKAKSAANSQHHVVNEAATSQTDKKLKEACKGFEAMFLNMMYRQMRATVPENTLFGTSNAEKIFQDMRDTELTKNIADSGGLGLADMMYRQLAPNVLAQAKSVKNEGNA